MRKSWLVPLAVLIASTVTSTAFTAETLSVVERVENETVVDLAGKGDTPGDLLIFTNPVFDAANALEIGSDTGNCVRTKVGQLWDCSWTLRLKDGQILAAGPVTDDGDSTIMILGGSGKYVGAKGTLLVHPRSKTSFDFKYLIL